MKIWFDMDGTIADLYGVDGWLEYLIVESVKPYKEAKVLLDMQVLARTLNGLKRKGYKVGIISWTAKHGSDEYNKAVAEAKQKWLAKHLGSIRFDSIVIVPYGTKKSDFAESIDDILFDDEEQNRIAWHGKAYDEQKILEILKNI